MGEMTKERKIRKEGLSMLSTFHSSVTAVRHLTDAWCSCLKLSANRLRVVFIVWNSCPKQQSFLPFCTNLSIFLWRSNGFTNKEGAWMEKSCCVLVQDFNRNPGSYVRRTGSLQSYWTSISLARSFSPGPFFWWWFRFFFFFCPKLWYNRPAVLRLGSASVSDQ